MCTGAVLKNQHAIKTIFCSIHFCMKSQYQLLQQFLHRGHDVLLLYPRCTILSTALGILDEILHGRIHLNHQFLCYFDVLSTDSTIHWWRPPATVPTSASVTSRAAMMQALGDDATTAPLPVSDHASSHCQDDVSLAAVPLFSAPTQRQLR